MAGPTARVLTLLELLQAGGLHTATRLAERLAVDERTVRRDLRHLEELGIPVDSVRGRYGGYRIGAGARLPPLMLTDEEAVTVAVALAGAPGSVAAETASAKIRRVLPAATGARLEALLGAEGLTVPPGPVPAPDPAVLLIVAEAVRDRRPLRIRHARGDGPARDRSVLPWGLVRSDGRWYLTGPDSASGQQRTFRVDRIEAAETIPGTFTVPTAFDAERQVAATLASTPWRHEVVLLLHASQHRIRQVLPEGVALLRDEPDRPGWVRARLRAEHLDWVAGAIAMLDAPFEVVRPEELRGTLRRLAVRLTDGASEPGDRTPSDGT